MCMFVFVVYRNSCKWLSPACWHYFVILQDLQNNIGLFYPRVWQLGEQYLHVSKHDFDMDVGTMQLAHDMYS